MSSFQEELALSTSTLINNSKWLQGDLVKEIKEIVHSSEFRNLIFKKQQMKYLYEKGTHFSYRVLSQMFQMSKSRIHTLMKTPSPEENKHNPNQLSIQGSSILSKEEEQEIIDWIAASQIEGDCPTPYQI